MNLDQLKKDIKAAEGFRGKPYLDTKGKSTIGYGHNLDDNPLTPEQATNLLDLDIHQALLACDALPWFRQLSDARQRALAEMCFNIGFGALQGFKKMLVALQAGAWETAAHELENSLYATQVPSRAHRLAAAIRLG